jgi:hypothetical protein
MQFNFTCIWIKLGSSHSIMLIWPAIINFRLWTNFIYKEAIWEPSLLNSFRERGAVSSNSDIFHVQHRLMHFHIETNIDLELFCEIYLGNILNMQFHSTRRALSNGHHWTSTSTASTSTNTWYFKNVLWTLLKYFLLEYIVLITCTKYHCTEVQ